MACLDARGRGLPGGPTELYLNRPVIGLVPEIRPQPTVPVPPHLAPAEKDKQGGVWRGGGERLDGGGGCKTGAKQGQNRGKKRAKQNRPVTHLVLKIPFLHLKNADPAGILRVPVPPPVVFFYLDVVDGGVDVPVSVRQGRGTGR